MIPASEIKVIYTGNSKATEFPFSFKFNDKSDIKVALRDIATEVMTVLTKDYFVDTVKSVVLYPGYQPGQEPPVNEQPEVLPSSKKIIIYRETPLSQTVDLGKKYPMAVVEGMDDKNLMISQELKEKLDRCVAVDIGADINPKKLIDSIFETAAKSGEIDVSVKDTLTKVISYAETAETEKNAAIAAANAATASKTAAGESAINAAASKAAAATSEENAKTAAAEAASNKTVAVNSAAAALASQQDAATSKAAAAASETAAAGSELVAIASQTAAAASAAAAQASADTANAYAGAVNCILRGLKISAVNGFSVSVDSGVVVANEVRKAILAGNVTMSPRKAALIYADNTGALGKVDGVYPTTYIDNSTVGAWIFNKSGTISNSAVGLSSMAVANDLVPAGTVIVVDGWCDYAVKADGISGTYTMSNVTNIPSGAAARLFACVFTCGGTSGNNPLWLMGSSSYFGVYVVGGNLKIYVNGTLYDTGFTCVQFGVYDVELNYDGATLYVLVGGTPVYSMTVTLSTELTTVKFFKDAGSTYAGHTLHYFEIRNAARSVATSGAIANKMLFPCFYTKTAAAYPMIPAEYVAMAHEYRMDETTGGTVADSNKNSPLNGIATGTTIADSDLALGKSRKLNGTSSDKISLGNFACGSLFSFVGVVNITAYGSQTPLWSNRPITNSNQGNMIWANISGVYMTIAGTAYTLVSQFMPVGAVVFIAVTINATSATVYINSGQKANTATIPLLDSGTYFANLTFDAPAPYYFNGKLDYALFGNFELTQAEIQQIYTSLMATGRRSIIDDVLTANQAAVAYVKTGNNGVTEYNDLWPMYGRREGTSGGNRKLFLGWTYFNGTTNFKWPNPFGTGKIKKEFHWSQDSLGTNELSVNDRFDSGGSYGILPHSYAAGYNDAQNITAWYGGGWMVCFNGANKTSGYVGCYAEMIEDFVGVM